jgi:hypothetical protein
MRDVAPQTLAIDGTALSAANQRCCHLLGFAIDVVAERPGDQPDTGHRLHGFGIDLIGINSRHEGRRTQSMHDEAGCDTRYVMRAHGRQRQRAAQYCRHEDDDSLFSGHCCLRQSLAIMACRT